MNPSRRLSPGYELRKLVDARLAPTSLAARLSVPRRLVGAGILAVTLFSGYTASRVAVPDPTTDAIIREAAIRYGVPEDVIAAVIEAESQFNPRAVSRRGAQGLMQLMPETAATLGVDDPFSPRENIHGGVRHLRSLMDRFDNDLPLVLAAYNAGERAVITHGGVPPYPQTRAYVRRIMRRLEHPTVKPAPRLAQSAALERDARGRR
jgi:soluble lytic murein transglycosylase-like protein